MGRWGLLPCLCLTNYQCFCMTCFCCVRKKKGNERTGERSQEKRRREKEENDKKGQQESESRGVEKKGNEGGKRK